MKKKYYYGNPVVVFGHSTQQGDDGFEWSYTKFSDDTSPEEGKEYPLSEVWDKPLVFDGIHRDNKGGTSEIEVHYLDKTKSDPEGKSICSIGNSFVEGNEFKLSNGYTKHDSETGTDINYQFDKTKSYYIRRNGSSGPPKVVFIYKNEDGANKYKEVTVQEIGTQIEAIKTSDVEITHYTFGDWNKVKAHYELVGDTYVVDEDLKEVVTFPKEVTEFNEYYQAELVPKKYNLALDSTQVFLDTTNQDVISVNNMVKLGEFNLNVSNDEDESIYIHTVKGNPTYKSAYNFTYKSKITVSFEFSIQEYTPYQFQITIADAELQGVPYDLTKGDNNIYTGEFEMPGQNSYIKILFTKNDSTN